MKQIHYRADPRVRLNDYVYQVLKDDIMGRKLAPGERLHLQQLAERLEVSLTPVKDALNQLAANGLVEIKPRRGFYVIDPSPQEVAESFEMRCAIESYAVQLVLERATDDELQKIVEIFEQLEELAQGSDRSAMYRQYVELDRDMHRRIIELSGNRRFLMAYDKEHTHMYMIRERYLRFEDHQRNEFFEDEVDKAQEEHRAIIQAMLARDVPSAQQILIKHINRVKQTLVNEMSGQTSSS